MNANICQRKAPSWRLPLLNTFDIYSNLTGQWQKFDISKLRLSYQQTPSEIYKQSLELAALTLALAHTYTVYRGN